MQLRPYQISNMTSVYSAWASGHSNVMYQLPTGGGKTFVFTGIVSELLPGLLSQFNGVALIAHRKELVQQISVALGAWGVYHDLVVANKNTVLNIVGEHQKEYGKSYFRAGAAVKVCSVDTLLSRADSLKAWASTVSYVVQDEAHHVVKVLKWGKAQALFPNARGLGVTATPIRGDGKGLGREYDGIYDTLIQGPTMRELIDAGYLTDYRILAPPNDIDLARVNVSASSGDYTRPGLKAAVRKSHIVGDVVEHYLKHAGGKLGVTFTTDVETAWDIKAQFSEAGVAAEVITAKTPDHVRNEILARFRRRDILMLINVDLFGEGFDLPAIEVVIMARPTLSTALYIQQFGRALRIAMGKGKALIIDHVGNVLRHGLPDAPREWSLAPREKRRAKGSELSPVKVCPECLGVYMRYLKACPECGHVAKPAVRSAPEFVDGDLQELDAEVLAAMRQAVEIIDGPYTPTQGTPRLGMLAGEKRHRLNQEAQVILRDAVSLWAGMHKGQGLEDSEIRKRFYLDFGVDVLSAQVLKAKDAGELQSKIQAGMIPLGRA